MGAFIGGFFGAWAGLISIFLLCVVASNKYDDWSDKK